MPIMRYKPVFEANVKIALKEAYADGVQYIEIRDDMGGVCTYDT